ncbi:hypothetical protein [Pseudomonas oryzihabitans]|uniref:Uncharacterized protein n=1 Tax=Pseudomonas oryzihabitans TaxID=47885 RepID=A0AAJ2BHF9_9PSED|nr:hypothetical protein [Pseudomonas psychrotolerans]MDR6234318.1 hypothetical protein [Pseudomonas psychrotolerans]MDR6356563.1 hypothetical protein [Pseudomonas psychrotolerans]
MNDSIFMAIFSILSLLLLGGGVYGCVILNRQRKDIEKNDSES